MSIVNALKNAGYKPEKSTVGDKPILVGVYKAMFVEWANLPDGKFGPQLSAQFKVTQALAGKDSTSGFPEFRDYYKTDTEGVSSKRNGLAKLLNGFFSVGINVDTSTDEALAASLDSLKGSAEVFIKAYVKEPQKKDEASGEWVANPDGSNKQGFTFLTEKNAIKEAAKIHKKEGNPLS